jgi:hypothetical protein
MTELQTIASALQRAAARGMAGAVLLAAPAAPAIERLTLEVAQATLPGGRELGGTRAALQLEPAGRSRLEVRAARLRLAPDELVTGLRVRCGRLIVREPHFACQAGEARALVPRIGAIGGRLEADADSGRSRATLRLSDLRIAGGLARLEVRLNAPRWQLEANGTDLELKAVRALLPADALPPDLEADGKLALQIQAAGSAQAWRTAALDASVAGVTVQNAVGTVATESLGAALHATLQPAGDAAHFELRLDHTNGQALAGPVLLDLGAQPLTLEAEGRIAKDGLEVTAAQVSQAGLLAASGSARVAFAPRLQLQAASIDLARLEFPAAYTSFLQLALAATELGTLQSQGNLSAHLEWRDGAPQSLDATLSGLDFADPARKLALRGVDGRLQWDAADGPVRASGIAWQSVELYGIEGGPGALALRAHGSDFALLEPARLPIFDGAVLLKQLELGALGTPGLRLAFAADIEPISMERLSHAFGWPAMAGRLSGSIPGLVYRDRALAFDGDLRAEVFDGTVTARKLRLIDPLGAFPRLTGDIEARRLDLDLITRTFPIGSITGRLDADIGGLELFGWSPVAFDAHLYTTPGDRSRHRISQKAVNSLSNLGGGGGVMGALQSGFLQFFRTFGYDRVALRCQLRDDVCLMDGIPRREGGFYIVRGSGLPRIDVVAGSGRVAWSRLVGQVMAALESGELTVR